MTDGTSQGLFIVVAIVIFGIFVVLAYILFEDTLSPALANMFTDATEQANNRLNEPAILIQDDPGIKKGDYNARNGVMSKADTLNTFSSNPSLELTFSRSQELDYNGGHDFVIGFQRKEVEFNAGDTVIFEFYAKSDVPVKLSTRLGSSFVGIPKENTIKNTWKKYKVSLPITEVMFPDHPLGAIVLYVDGPSTIWLSDYSIKLIQK